MHELAVTQSLLEIALRHGAQAGARRIVRLHLVIGDLSSIVDDSVQFYWDFISRGTPAEGAQLHIRRIAAALACQACHHVYPPGDQLACPVCASVDTRIMAGEEFYLEAIDIADAETAEVTL
jgi:hydrogenase nickel incorporation protein HypA/HybF